MLDVAEPYDCMNCPLLDCRGLRPLDETQRAYMNTIKQGEKLFERGDTILREDDEVQHLNTVLEGVLIRYRSLEDGRRQIVNFMFPGDLVGLQGAFDEPSSHSVEALISSRLCVFRRDEFVNLIKQNPRLGFDVTWLAAKEETALESHIVSLGQRSAKERVVFLAVWLLDRAIATGLAHDNNVLDIPVTQSQIADMLGLSLVHTNRTIRALDREGLVQWGTREICVPDMEKAADFADFERSDRGTRPYI
ncbi:Crp/Fnr family transcriptional regulator [Qipengyuania sphaerica]|uniref:Crp/Fnr family transcriptional regulator n=1 Tax=Qipengyuania sphaerica TaxID=2867243 RepID=UPI001C89746A|nr:Crp/Fnr family transcriptional regulator [Qipengyuania sphaerica]MBX7542028.1 Crp/Fnr family transcriptional regulator [Qipengyuania sphaerica]